MAAYLSPVGNSPLIDSNGDPLVGGKIYTYVAGTSTAAATYTTSAAAVQQANPIVLNANGCPDSPIWIGGGTTLKFVIKDSSDVTLSTIDNVTGINDPALTATTDEWVLFAGTPTYISATSFSLQGDQTNTLQVNRRIKTANTAGTRYSTISASSYNAGTGLTTVTVINDSGSLDSGLSSVSHSLLGATNPSLPTMSGRVLQQVLGTDAGTTTTSATLANVTAAEKTITPKSANSKLLVECSFQAIATASGAGVNSVAGFRLYNNTAGANIGVEYSFGVSSGTGANLQAEGALTLRAIVSNSSTSQVGFVLRARQATGTPTVSGTNQVWTITEIPN